jgi:agmatinase
VQVGRPGEPSYAGGATFQKVPLVLDSDQLNGADVVFVGAPMDDLVTYRPGTRFGPREIRFASDDGQPEMYNLELGIDPFDELRIVDHGDAPVKPGDAHASHRAVREAVNNVLDAGAVPIILGGDHSIAFPDISSVASRYEHGTVAVVQFDTHADTATELNGLKWSHGTPFRHLVDEGIIAGERLVQVGLRGYWPYPEEFDWARSKGVRWHRMGEVTERGIDAVIDDVLAEVADAEHLFLSVDIDVLDPAYAPGTGTPEPGGMTSRELLSAVRRLTVERGFVGMDLVEVSPPYDHAGITATAAHRVVCEALSGLALNRRDGKPKPENPS